MDFHFPDWILTESWLMDHFVLKTPHFDIQPRTHVFNFFLLTALLWYNLYAIKFIQCEGTIQWNLVNLRSCETIFTVEFYNLSITNLPHLQSIPVSICSHSVFTFISRQLIFFGFCIDLHVVNISINRIRQNITFWDRALSFSVIFFEVHPNCNMYLYFMNVWMTCFILFHPWHSASARLSVHMVRLVLNCRDSYDYFSVDPRCHHFQLDYCSVCGPCSCLTYLSLKETIRVTFINFMSHSFTPCLASPNGLLGKSMILTLPARTCLISLFFLFYCIFSPSLINPL